MLYLRTVFLLSIHPSYILYHCFTLADHCTQTDKKYASIQLLTPSPLIFLIGQPSLTSQVDHVKLENIRLELKKCRWPLPHCFASSLGAEKKPSRPHQEKAVSSLRCSDGAGSPSPRPTAADENVRKLQAGARDSPRVTQTSAVNPVPRVAKTAANAMAKEMNAARTRSRCANVARLLISSVVAAAAY